MIDDPGTRIPTRPKEGYGPWRGCRGLWTAGFARVPDGPRVDGCSAPAHRLTTGPWTTLRVALSHLDSRFAPDHTAHSLDDDDEQTIMEKEKLPNREHS